MKKCMLNHCYNSQKSICINNILYWVAHNKLGIYNLYTKECLNIFIIPGTIFDIFYKLNKIYVIYTSNDGNKHYYYYDIIMSSTRLLLKEHKLNNLLSRYLKVDIS